MADILKGEGGFFRDSPSGPTSPGYLDPLTIEEFQELFGRDEACLDSHTRERLALSKLDNLIMMDGESYHFPVIERAYPYRKYQVGVALVNGQRFSVWRESGAVGHGHLTLIGKPWHLGALHLTRYRVNASALKGKAFKRAIETLQPLCSSFDSFCGTGWGEFRSEQVATFKDAGILVTRMEEE